MKMYLLTLTGSISQVSYLIKPDHVNCIPCAEEFFFLEEIWTLMKILSLWYKWDMWKHPNKKKRKKKGGEDLDSPVSRIHKA